MSADSEAAPVKQLPDRQARLDKIEYLISVYRMRHMHYVWRDHMPEAGEMERKIDRLLERWQRVRNRELAEASS
jgi:chemotaxis regulatin CheY-phosphate phosphatase CheZ